MEERVCQLRVLGQDSFKNYNVEIDILSSGPVQRGHWEFRNLDKYAKTFVGCPILCAYVLTQMAEIFGVTVDYLLSAHDAWENPNEPEEQEQGISRYSVNMM